MEEQDETEQKERVDEWAENEGEDAKDEHTQGAEKEVDEAAGSGEKECIGDGEQEVVRLLGARGRKFSVRA